MPIFPLRRSSRIARRRRPTGQGIGMESLESRRLLDANNGYIKIDLAQLDQTGQGGKYDIYMLGYASSSGQILQQDPVSKKISLGSPVPADTVVSVTPTMVSGSSVTLSTNANLFVGGDVTFSNGTKSTIASIAANVVTANQVTGSVQSVTVTAKGSGYTSAPTVTITDTTKGGGPGQGATAVAVLGTGADSDKVVGIRLTNLGQNYVQANVSITLTGGGGAGANASIVINAASVFLPTQPFGWTSDSDAAILGAASVNQGTVSNNTATTSQVTDVPVAAGVQSGIRLDSLVTGYITPSGTMPTADAAISGGSVTGFTNLVTNSGQYQYAPTVTFPGAGVTKVATGLCTIDPATGFVNGVTFTPTNEYPNLTSGAGYDSSSTYPANFSSAPGNTFFYPTDPYGFPGPTGAAAAAVTSLTTSAGNMTIDLSQAVASPSWASQPPISLGSTSALNIYSGGANADGFATFVPMATVTVTNGTGATTILNTSIQFDPTALPTMTVPSVGIQSQNYAAGTPTLDATGRLTGITFSPTAFSTYADGTYSIFASAFSALTPFDTPSFSVSNLLSTSAVEAYNVAYNIAGSSLAVERVPGTSTIYSIPSYTITFADAVPSGTTSLSFSPDVAGTVSNDGSTLTMSTASNGGYPGIPSGLAIGMKPTISLADGTHTTGTIAALAIAGTTITVTFQNPLSTTFQAQQVSVALPPTGGSLPVIKWDNVTNNAIWAEQTPNGAKGSISVNGGRVYFILDTLNLGPPSFDYAVSVNATGDETITVTQPPDALVWSGQVSPFQYVELTADAMPLAGNGGDGKVYVDLSAVDGFFFPAALSSGTLLMGQPWDMSPQYTSPNTTGPNTYAAVTRTQILDAWKTFFSTDAATNFVGTGAAALGQAYAALQVSSTAGIQNPSFAYATPTTKIPAFDHCWDTALDALYVTGNQIDLIGDLLIGGPGGQTAYYKGAQTAVNGYPAIEFTEYSTNYQTPTGAKFWVFDPRNPPPSEVNAFAIDNGVSTKMTTGYQIFANTGVYNSGSIISSGSTPNYQAGTLSPWDTGDALKQLLSLERQVVTALNRGVGEFGIGTVNDGHSTNAPGPGVTSDYWNNEATWYHYAAPYSAATPQNIFSQWVHTAVIDQPTNTYFATYPLGGAYGEPARAWGSGGPGTGPYMNQTYGFGYDETPNDGANVPSKYQPIVNAAGNEANPLTFQLVFGPWDKPPATAPYVQSIATNPPEQGTTPTPTTASTVTWTVTFSEMVTGVATTAPFSNFTLVPSDGLSGTSITSVTPNGTGPYSQSWTVTASTGTGSGTLGLNLSSVGSIKDQAGNLLSGTKTGQVYSVRPTPVGPTATITLADQSPTAAATVGWNVSFTDAVSGLSASNFELIATGITGFGPAVVAPVGTQPTKNWTVSASTGTGSGTLALKLANANSVTPAPTVPVTSVAYTIDKDAPTAPTISGITLAGKSPTSASSVAWTITFSEPVTGLTAANLQLVPTGLTGAGNIQVTPSSSTLTATWTVTASTGTGTGTLGLTMQNSTGVADASSQAVTNVPYTKGGVYTIDRTAPALQAITRADANPTQLPQVHWTVRFSEAVSGVNAANFQLKATGLTGYGPIEVTPTSGSSTVWTVTAASGSGTGTLELDMVNGHGITDAADLPPTGIPLDGPAYNVQRSGASIVTAPIGFWTSASKASPLVWSLKPFIDSDSTTLTVALSVPAGTFTATSGSGVTVTPSATPSGELQFTGTVQSLNAFFMSKRGLIRYTPQTGSLVPQTLTLSAQGSDSKSGLATAAIMVKAATAQSPRPSINGSATLTGPVGKPLVITYDQLVTASGATETQSRSVVFTLMGIQKGKLEYWAGSRWLRVPNVKNQALLVPGGQLRWTPPSSAPQTGPAFRVRTFDGWQSSAVVAQINVTLT